VRPRWLPDDLELTPCAACTGRFRKPRLCVVVNELVAHDAPQVGDAQDAVFRAHVTRAGVVVARELTFERAVAWARGR
jgi:hypothetical protein